MLNFIVDRKERKERMKKAKILFAISLLLLVFSGCSKNTQGNNPKDEKKIELTVSAAASLQDALNDIKANFEKEYVDVKINFNFGASGALQQQIIQGAPVDLFFSAAEDKFDGLVEKGLIEKKKGIDLIGNELVLVVPKNSSKGIKTFEDLNKLEKISIGTPEAVPAGQYAKETLESLKIWKAVEPKLIYAKDVRQVLTYVETGNVDAGIVYKTDALHSSKVMMVAAAEENTHTPIIYPVGIIKKSIHTKEAKLFYDYLQTKKSIAILKKYGFSKIP